MGFPNATVERISDSKSLLRTKNSGDYFDEISKGKIEGHEIINIFGSSLDLDINDGLSQVVNFAKSYPYKTANALLSVVSDDVADTDIVIQITGVDEDFEEVVEILPIDGTTPVNTVANFIAVNRALVVVSGGITGNQGDITFSHSGDVIAQINQNLGSTEHGIYYIPAGHSFMVDNVFASLVKASGSSGTKEMNIRVNVSGGGTTNSMGSSLPIGLRSTNGPFVLTLKAPQTIPEKNIITFLATALVNNSAVNVGIMGRLVDNNFL